MPFDFSTTHDLTTYSGRLRFLADRVEKMQSINMVFFWCGTAGCALGEASHMPEFQVLGMVPMYTKRSFTDKDRVNRDIMLGKHWSRIFKGWPLFTYCFGGGIQFCYLKRPYTPADVARHLRETADFLKEEKANAV